MPTMRHARLRAACAAVAAAAAAAVEPQLAWSVSAGANAAQVGGEVAACGARNSDGSGHCAQQDHLLLQLGAGGGGGRLATASAANATARKAKGKGPGDVASGAGCHGMIDVEKDCGHHGCLVLASEMRGFSCDEYCHRSGRTCLAAWEEVDETCDSMLSLRCDETYGTTSDLLCRCSSEVVGLDLQSHGSDVWELVWSDEFDGVEVDRSKWGFVEGGGGFGNSELQHYTDRAENARVHDGILSITAQCEKYGHESFTSAKLTTEQTAGWGPGHRVEVRAKLPTGKGTWPAIWMLPVDEAYGDWPKSGELDIMEAVGCTEDTIYGTAHTDAYNHMHSSQAYNKKTLSLSEWHTYSIEWKQDGVEWFVDGELYVSFAPSSHSSDKWPFDKEFYLILNLAVGGAWGGNCLRHGWPSCSSGSEFGQPQVMEVDFARVYALKS